MTDAVLPSIPYRSPAKPTTNTAVMNEDAASDEVCLVLHNLHWWTSDEDLRKFFGTRGAHLSLLLRSIRFAEDKRSGRSMGVAMVTFVRRAHAMAALDLINAFAEVDDLATTSVAAEGETGSIGGKGMDARVMNVERATEECKPSVVYLNSFLLLSPCNDHLMKMCMQ